MPEQKNIKTKRPVVLCILDGWGERGETENNAIALAHTPHWDRILASCPTASLATSAEAVGLPAGQMGNSEVGHTNLGAGRVVLQDLPRIDAAIADGIIAKSPALVSFITALKNYGGVCHLMGLLSPGGVHAHSGQMTFLARHIAASGVPVKVHAFMDGRDTPPKSGLKFMADFLASIKDVPAISIATVSGRYYVMDRDNRWDRVALGYQALAGSGNRAADPLSAIDSAYRQGDTDEFIKPTVIGDYAGMADGDGLFMANFRSDRVREILAALVDPDFDGFGRDRRITFAAKVGMVEYSDHLNRYIDVLFPSVALAKVLGEVVSSAGLKQLRIAETEKYAHVTFFFNGGQEEKFPGEERILVPSPQVATYDLQPEMSAGAVTDHLIKAIDSGRFDLIVVNYANGDMVGHTGILAAAIKAAETVDTCLGRLETAVTEAGGVMLITADHGNCEAMKDNATGQPHTAHTLNRVPVVLVNGGAVPLHDGTLADVAPTLLAFLGLEQPAEMTGRPLVETVREPEAGERVARAR